MVYMSLQEEKDSIHSHTGYICDLIIKNTLVRKSQHNVSTILITFSNFENAFNKNLIKSDNNKKTTYVNTEPNIRGKVSPRLSEVKIKSKRVIFLNSSK
jgi:hypothetical protein